MKDENMLKKEDFDDAEFVAALRRGHRQRLYFEQIAVFRHKFINYSGELFHPTFEQYFNTIYED
jgi:hypothetical protein